MRKLNIDIFGGLRYPALLPLVKEAGFDGFATFYVYANDLPMLTAQVEQGKSLGLSCDCVHSTIPGEKAMWVKEDPEGDVFAGKLLQTIDYCAMLGVPMTVVHVSAPEEGASFSAGIQRLEKIVGHAGEKGIQIAFENIDHVQFLVDTLRHFEGAGHVGFCYDSGHEAVWTPGERLLPIVGGRLIYTHLHDNDLADDLHILPFDGKIDFERICREIRDTGYRGSLMLELDYSAYADKMTPVDFLRKCRSVADILAEKIG